MATYPKPPSNLTRREALKLAGATLAVGALAPHAFAAGAAPARARKKVIVVGAGIGGLCCAYELLERGHDVILLEASRRTGGHVKTIRDPLPDGLYADVGAEQITRPGYAEFWRYVEKFGLTALPWDRRRNMYRRIDGQWYTEEQLVEPAVLARLGLNSGEIDYVVRHGWGELRSLYLAPYAAKITDEANPFGVGLDHLDRVPVGDLLAQDGASDAARRFSGAGRRTTAANPPARSDTSALFRIWHAAILKGRGIPAFPRDVFHLKGGNQVITDTFAAKLGDRIHRNCPVTAIEHTDAGVKVQFTRADKPQEVRADHLVLAVSPLVLAGLTVTPNWPAAKAHALLNTSMDTYSRVLLQTRNAFWKGDTVPSINLDAGDPRMTSTWETAQEIPGERRLLMGYGRAVQSPEETTAAFHEFYPGKNKPVIEQSIVHQWWKEEPTCVGCERRPFPLGELALMWPRLIAPVGRVHFVGAAYDTLGWGMDAATRSGNRVAKAIDLA
jgi:monoamine oxidase